MISVLVFLFLSAYIQSGNLGHGRCYICKADSTDGCCTSPSPSLAAALDLYKHRNSMLGPGSPVASWQTNPTALSQTLLDSGLVHHS